MTETTVAIDMRAHAALPYLRACRDRGEAPLEAVYAEQRSLDVAVAMLSLSRREIDALSWHFGFDDEPLPYREVGARLGVSGGRAGQIIAKALRKLRHPSQANILREFIDWRRPGAVQVTAQATQKERTAPKPPPLPPEPAGGWLAAAVATPHFHLFKEYMRNAERVAPLPKTIPMPKWMERYA